MYSPISDVCPMLDKKPCNIEMTLKDARVGQGLESQRERSLAAEVNTKVDRASNCTIEGEAALAKGTASIESASGAEALKSHRRTTRGVQWNPGHMTRPSASVK